MCGFSGHQVLRGCNHKSHTNISNTNGHTKMFLFTPSHNKRIDLLIVLLWKWLSWQFSGWRIAGKSNVFHYICGQLFQDFFCGPLDTDSLWKLMIGFWTYLKFFNFFFLTSHPHLFDAVQLFRRLNQSCYTNRRYPWISGKSYLCNLPLADEHEFLIISKPLPNQWGGNPPSPPGLSSIEFFFFLWPEVSVN